MGVKIPEALLLLGIPVPIHHHQQLFLQDEPDDTWLPKVGEAEWIVVGQDYRYHLRPNELAALKQYNVGCFYLWGAEAPRWETARVFMKAYDKLALAAQVTARPFVYRVEKSGRLRQETI